jgi:hypothetical protein
MVLAADAPHMQFILNLGHQYAMSNLHEVSSLEGLTCRDS